MMQNVAVSSPTSGNSNLGPLHVIDQVILDTARKFRFTVEEVKEYYDRCGDLNRTTNRFAHMREVLANLPDDGPPAFPVPLMDNEPPKTEGIADEVQILQNIMKSVT
jgi:hypothetical protein